MGKGIINTFRTLVQAGLLSYMEMDPSSVSGVDTSIGPFMKADVLFKDADRKLDMRMETSQGVQEFKDYPLSLRWTGRLRNLKFTKTIKRLMDMKIISPCVVTRESVRTNDNVTYSMGLESCWTLASGHCGKTPNFGVFTKKSGSKMATLAVIKLKLIPMEESKSMEMESASQKERNMFVVNLVMKSSKFSNGELASMFTLSCVFGYLQIPIMYKYYQLPLQEETNVVCVVISIEINSMNIWARMALLWHLAVVIKLLNGSGSAKISMLVF